MTIAAPAFASIAAILERLAGLKLGADKAYLLESRLLPIARRRGLATVGDLASAIRQSGADAALESEIVEAMLNNETFFYRDQLPFQLIEKAVLPRLRETRADTRRLRIWCAACSTGQEPYSLAMMFADAAPDWRDWSIDILATDLSLGALKRARSGLYSQFEVQRGLPVQKLVRHFTQEGEHWRLNADIRERVRFRQLNLCGEWGLSVPFDLVLCRNVLIYLGPERKRDVLMRLREQIAPDGSLILGAAETLLGYADSFMPDLDNRGLYRRVELSPPPTAAPARYQSISAPL